MCREIGCSGVGAIPKSHQAFVAGVAFGVSSPSPPIVCGLANAKTNLTGEDMEQHNF